jgi:acetyl-CoA synthetase
MNSQTARASRSFAELEPLCLDWDESTQRYRVRIPENANIAADTVTKHAAGAQRDAVAIRFERTDGECEEITYARLDYHAGRFAAWLRSVGVQRGRVVAIHSGARIETVVAHLAAYKLGAIAATLSQLYGPDTVRHILKDSGACVLITQDTVWRSLAGTVRDECEKLAHVVVIGAAAGAELTFDSLLSACKEPVLAVPTRAEDPALLIYTSGSTGHPKGVLHAHRILHAYTPTLQLFNNLELEEPGAIFWTAADWAWVGGLNDIVYPALQFGHTLIASQHRFDPQWSLDFMARHRVTHTLLTPTALNRLAQIQRPRERWQLALRTIFTGGESLPGETLRWLEDELGVVCNEGYGMSEVNHMIGNCKRLRPTRPGSMGWECPGHVAALVDENAEPVPDGHVGEIVTSAQAPTLFLGYWNQPELTAAMRLGPWIRTRDLAVRDADGYFWYRGRADDLIKSAGYRIGPVEIEEVLMQHPAVGLVAVVGVPDATRGQAVKAFIQLTEGSVESESLVEELRAHVKAHLGSFKAPRIIEFMQDLPTTSTGKVARSQLRSLGQQRHTVGNPSIS